MTAEPDEGLSSDEPLTHGAARQRFGLPDEVEGSVNDPRTREEHGIRWNECWTYRLSGGQRRRIYWHRYDFRGIRIEAPPPSAGKTPA